MTNIKNILFDFGNVLYDIDLPRAERELEDLSKQLIRPPSHEEIHALVEQFSEGRMSADDFVRFFVEGSKGKLSDNQVVHAWNVMLLDMPEHRFTLLEELKKKYDLYLLSNNNELHLAAIYGYLEDKYGITDFDTRYFKKTYYSHKIGIVKPKAEAYQFVIADSGIDPTVTLFVDDLPENLSAAEKLGFRALHSPLEEDVWDQLKEFVS